MPSSVQFALSNTEAAWLLIGSFPFSPVLPIGTGAGSFQILHRTVMQVCPFWFCLDSPLNCDLRGVKGLRLRGHGVSPAPFAFPWSVAL